MVMQRDKLMRNPQDEFRKPQHIVECQELSDEQKIQLLLNWRLDLLELQRADAENMQADGGDSGDLAVDLKNVTDALRMLDADPRTGRRA